MKQYLDLLQDIVDNGEWKNPAREGMPRTKSVFARTMRFNLQDGFPLLTTKKVFYRGVIHELLWFLRGETNIKYLVENKCNFWTPDAYKYYLRKVKEWNEAHILDQETILTQEEFVENIFKGDISQHIGWSNYTLGDLGNVYGSQWRHWGGDDFDQLNNLINSIKKNPDSRYHLVTAWNPTDFLQHPENAALPACHMEFMCYVRENKYLDLKIFCRSQDTLLGTPFNIACYAIMTHIIAKLTGYEPGELIWDGGDVHLYENHMEQVAEQLSREPRELPKLIIKDRGQQTFEDFEFNDFEIIGYDPHPSIKAELSVGK